MRIGIDAGGTFTDFVVLNKSGELRAFKLRSNPRDPAAVILAGIAMAAGGAKRAEVIHGSTVATNALLERKGARTAFVTTAGFADLLEIGRQNRAALYDLTPAPKRLLTPRALCLEVNERAHADGTIARRPAAAELRKLRAALGKAEVEAIAICLLHAYQTPENEEAVAAALTGLGYVCRSSEVCPEFREYERGSTTVLNAYVGPLMDRYLAALERESPYPLSIMQSNGGLLRAAEARRQAVRTVLSGPAGGVVGAFHVARQSGYTRVLGFDMGGTSTDVSLSDGAPRETVEAVVDGVPIRVPMLDIHTVGAGGGSMARVDEGGLLRVGPESAGSDPGPACYGVGLAATVTDAQVVLGRITAEQLLGGEMRLEVERAEAAVDRVAAELGLDRVATAAGIVRVANANMERAIRAVSIERGYDPRQFALVAFGGGGGLHACEIARELGMRTVLAPEHAGVLSALGMLLAPHVRDYAAGVLGVAEVESRYRALEQQAKAESPRARLERFADVRYAGQSYELTIPWQGEQTAAAFHAEHQKVYGYADAGRRLEVVTIRVRATVAVKPPRLEKRPGAAVGELEKRPGAAAGELAKRRVFVDGRWQAVRVVRREQIPASGIAGPALVVDYGSTVLALGGWRMKRDRVGTLVLVNGRA